MIYQIEALEKRHDRTGFDCGSFELNTFLADHARQNQSKGLSRTFVLMRDADPRVVGYYTISVAHVEFDELPPLLRAKLPRYPLPVGHLGRLATCLSVRGQGLGEVLLIDALKRVERTADQIGIAAIDVRAKGTQAKEFYEKYGFSALPDSTDHLYLPLSRLRRALGTPATLADT